MKKSIVSFIFLLATNFVFAQNYLSIFGKNSTEWSLVPFTACDATYTSNHYISSDTIINNMHYKILSQLGLLREDTISGKVWFWSLENKKEYLVMDLNLKEGDFFNIYSPTNDTIPIKVEKVAYINNKKTIQFNLKIKHCQSGMKVEKWTFIEGSGPNNGFYFRSNSFITELYSFMACHYKDGIKVLGNTLFNDLCSFNYTSTTETIGNKKINLYIKDDVIFIQSENRLGNCKVILSDLAGRLIFQQSINDNYKDTILPFLSAGMYIVTLVQNEKPIKNLKIVK